MSFKNLTATCDLSTGKIYGCKRGSFKWYHEKGHFIFNSDDKFSFLILLKGYFKDTWLFFTMLSILYFWFIIWAVTCWWVYFSIFIFEEMWCDNYARKKLNKKVL